MSGPSAPPSARRRPDPDRLVKAVLKDRLADGVTVVNRRPNDFLSRLPLVAAHSLGGTGTRMRRHRTFADVDAFSYAETGDVASDLDDHVLGALEDAARYGDAHHGGRIGSLEVVTYGAEYREGGQPGRFRCWRATYRLDIRPA